MSPIIIGISEFAVNTDSGATLITYSLGSCLGVTAFDQKKGIGGLLHAQLALSKSHPEKAAQTPAMFVDLGMLVLLEKMIALGAQKENLVIKAAGCAEMSTNNFFNISQNNITVFRKFMWKNNLLISAQDLGGDKPRTLSLEMDTGKSFIKSDGVYRELV